VPTRFEIFYEPYGRRFDVQVFPTTDGGLATYGRDITEQWHANEMLLDADRRKDRFLATLAHELRNPLAPVRNAVKLLQLKGTADPDIRWAHTVMERQVDHLTRLIDDLMDVSRISHDRLELRPTRVRLADVIAGAVESCRPIMDAHRHQLSISLPSEHVYLKADAVRLAQVFVNLLTNAAKYTQDAGRIVVTATLEGGDIVVRIADSGVGFDRDEARRLFEMFYQGRDVLGRQHGGLGVGLALAQHLVKLHSGSIAAASGGRGRGSEFTVRLPIASEQETQDATEMLSPRAWSPLAGHRVLIVDDNEDAAASLGVLFQLASAEVHLAHSGAQSLAVASRCKPEVILLDIGLPDLSGYEVAREIRQASWSTRTVLIALTGWGQPEDRERSGAAGFDRHLVKPAQPDELMACVLDALTEKGTETRH
jgi:two-component system CheB/CheR fusion protein